MSKQNPMNEAGKVTTWVDQEKLNITVGNGLDHSHTVISPNGQVLYDRDWYRNVLIGNPNQHPLFPTGQGFLVPGKW